MEIQDNSGTPLYVVTACDHAAYESMLIPFIASLRSLGKWDATIRVVDLGLTDKEKDILLDNDIKIIPRINTLQSNVCDRFSSIAEYFKDEPESLLAVYDADVWFCDEVAPIFLNEIGHRGLTCTHDATWQGFLMGCVIEKHDMIKEIYEKIRDELGYVLQVGFVGGTVKAYCAFARLQEWLIRMNIARDIYGTDTLVLNVYYELHKEDVNICSVAYNCLPDWGIYKENDKFFNAQMEIPITALHVTSPHRSHGRFSFEKHFPDIYNHYQKILVS